MVLVIKPTKIVKGKQWTQRQEIYRYSPEINTPPEKVAQSLSEFMQTLDHTSEIYNQLKLGRDANCSEKLAKVYLSKNGYYLNPFLEDFKQANKLAGVNESKNLDDVVEDLTTFEEEAKMQYIKTSKRKQENKDIATREAKSLLKEFGLADTKKNIEQMKKEIAQEKVYDKQLKLKTSAIQNLRESWQNASIRENMRKKFESKAKLRAKKLAMSRGFER